MNEQVAMAPAEKAGAASGVEVDGGDCLVDEGVETLIEDVSIDGMCGVY